jgi:hypothetical protein
VTEFDYTSLDAGHDTDLSDVSPQELEAAQKAFRILLEWIWQNGMRNPNGVKIRAIICCWIFLQQVRKTVNLTKLAKGYGMKKQSLGRWVDNFKRDFPQFKVAHMRNNQGGPGRSKTVNTESCSPLKRNQALPGNVRHGGQKLKLK